MTDFPKYKCPSCLERDKLVVELNGADCCDRCGWSGIEDEELMSKVLADPSMKLKDDEERITLWDIIDGMEKAMPYLKTGD